MTHAHTLHSDLAGNSTLLTSLGYDFVIQELIEVIREGLRRDGMVRLHQFGTFRLRYSKPRPYKHPVTGVIKMLSPSPRVTFKPAKHLRDQIQKIPVANAAANTYVEKHLVTSGIAVNPDTILPDLDEFEYVAPNPKKKKNKLVLVGFAAVGVLAAIPFMLSVLQNDFKSPVGEMARKPAIQSIASVTPPIVRANTNSSIQPDIVVPGVQNGKPELDNRTRDVQPEIIYPDSPDTTAASGTADLSEIQELDNDTVSPAKYDTGNSKTYFLQPSIHKVSKGESLWQLAATHYNNPLYWPYIYRANQRVLSNPNRIAINMNLVIPGLQHPPASLSKRDSQAIAQGYFLLYEYHLGQGNPRAGEYLIGARRFDATIAAKTNTATGYGQTTGESS